MIECTALLCHLQTDSFDNAAATASCQSHGRRTMYCTSLQSRSRHPKVRSIMKHLYNQYSSRHRENMSYLCGGLNVKVIDECATRHNLSNLSLEVLPLSRLKTDNYRCASRLLLPLHYCILSRSDCCGGGGLQSGHPERGRRMRQKVNIRTMAWE